MDSHSLSDKAMLARASWEKYCNQTSLHGLSYIVTEKPKLSRIFWVIIVIIFKCFSLFFVFTGYTEFVNSKTITSINSTTASLADLYFPSVFICNINQVTATILSKMSVVTRGQIAQSELDFINEIYRRYIKADAGDWENTTIRDSFNKGVNETAIEETLRAVGWNLNKTFLLLASQESEDALLRVTWKTTMQQEFFAAYKAMTDYGACQIIFPHLDFEDDDTKNLANRQYTGQQLHDINYGIRNGIDNGLSILADAESFDYAYFYRMAKGFMIAMADNRDKAVINQKGFYVSPGTETLVSITAERLVTTDQAMKRFIPADRDCYDDAEFKFKYLTYDAGYRYSMENCLYESATEKILDICLCKPSFITFDLPGIKDLPQCRGIQLACAQYYMDNMGNDDPNLNMTWALNENNEKKQCRQRCTIQLEKPVITISRYPNVNTFESRDDMCIVAYKILRICLKPDKLNIFDNFYRNEKPFNYLSQISDICRLTQDQIDAGICSIENGKIVLNPENNMDQRLYDFLFHYAEENIVEVKIFFREPYYTQIVQGEKMTVISFIGNTGGLMGLCIGLSFVSIAEIVYHVITFFLRLYGCNCNKVTK